MAMRKTGDWEKVGSLISNLSNEMKKARELSLNRFGLKAEALAKGHMSRQDLNWPALKPKTISTKVRKGYSENILIATSDYFLSITSFVKGDTVYVGVKKESKNRDGRVIANIAAIHEFGAASVNIPARPLWQPTLNEAVEWHKKKNLPILIFAKRIEKYCR